MEKSEHINELVTALAKARAQFEAIKKSAANPFFKSKYADLSEIVGGTAEALSANGLALMQFPGDVAGGQVVILTMLAHSSGQWIGEQTTMPVSKNDAQGIGSAITYGRRYAMQSILNVAADFDDDGEAAVGRQKIAEAEARFDAKEDVYLAERIAPFQVKALEERWRANAWTEKQVSAFLSTLGKYVQLEEIAKAHFNEAMKAFSKPPAVPEDLTKALQASFAAAVEGKPAAKAPAAPKKGPNRFAKLFAITGKKKISDEDLRQTAREIYGKDHLSDLNAEELAWMEGWAEEQTGQ